MVFTGSSDMRVDTGGGGSLPGSYTWIDSRHVMVKFFGGSPRLVWCSPGTGDMSWTNHDIGVVLRYIYEPGSFVTVQVNRALGL